MGPKMFLWSEECWTEMQVATLLWQTKQKHTEISTEHGKKMELWMKWWQKTKERGYVDGCCPSWTTAASVYLGSLVPSQSEASITCQSEGNFGRIFWSRHKPTLRWHQTPPSPSSRCLSLSLLGCDCLTWSHACQHGQRVVCEGHSGGPRLCGQGAEIEFPRWLL